jgi:hypothetical protein
MELLPPVHEIGLHLRADQEWRMLLYHRSLAFSSRRINETLEVVITGLKCLSHGHKLLIRPLRWESFKQSCVAYMS